MAFAASWVALRLYYYPAVIIRAAAFDAPRVLGGRPPGWHVLVAGTLVVLLLNCYWRARPLSLSFADSPLLAVPPMLSRSRAIALLQPPRGPAPQANRLIDCVNCAVGAA